MIRGRMTALSNPNPLRTPVVDGAALRLPELGARFVFFSESLTEAGVLRNITTTPVTLITGNVFTTESGNSYSFTPEQP